jgi:sporulation protein YlmC with PRC-barrel domain
MDLVGRSVRDERGRRLGRVCELEAEREGEELCVSALIVGSRSWLERFGWAVEPAGRRIAWEQVLHVTPEIVVRSEGKA